MKKKKGKGVEATPRSTVKVILIVEDDDSFREMLRTVLETRGFTVLTAANTGEGLEIAACRTVDAVVTDYQMPKKNGLEFCRALRKQTSALGGQLPVWLMTGNFSLTPERSVGRRCPGHFPQAFPCGGDFQSNRTPLAISADECRNRTMSNTPSKLAVLVADDSAEIRSTLEHSLEAFGHSVTCATTGKEAIKLLEAEYFDLVITDILMPDAGGPEVIGEVQKRYPTTRIVAMTGGGQALDSNYCLHLAKTLGAHVVIEKPFQMAQFTEAASKALPSLITSLPT